MAAREQDLIFPKIKVCSSTEFGEGNVLSRPELFCCMHTTQSLSEREPNPAAARSSLLLEGASKLLTVVPLGTAARGRDCHTNRRHTGCSVTAYDFTQRKKLLFPYMKYQREKKYLSRVRHLTFAVQNLRRKVLMTVVQVDLKRTCQFKKK